MYVGLLSASLLLLVYLVGQAAGFGDIEPFIVFTLLYAGTESALVIFHHREGRVGLSAAEAVFMPMLIALTLEQLVLAVVIGAVVVNLTQLRFGGIKALFNVAQFGVSASLAGWVYALGADPQVVLSPRNVVLAFVAVLFFALATHLFVSGAIALAEGRSFLELSKGIARETVLNFVVNVAVGTLFVAAYSGANWTAILFPLPLAALYLGYRAILRQEQERERVEKLHEATRALAASPNLGEAVTNFLEAVCKLVSSREAVLLVALGDDVLISRVEGGRATALMDPAVDEVLTDFAQHLRRTAAPIIVAEHESSPWRNWADDIGARSMLAAPLDDDHLGCLIAIDREGADEFGKDDARLLDALAQELMLSLGSYRLFAQVSEERERFGRIFTGSKDGICLLDDEGKILAWNPSLESITGYAADEVIGHQLTDRILVRDERKRRLGLWDFVGADPDGQLELVTKDGPGRWISVMSGSVRSGQEESWVVLVRDVTAEHQAEESKSDFLSTISHELRTPLTSIKGSLQVLARGTDLPEGVHSQMVDVLQRSSDRLERLLLNLLFVSRVETDGELSVIPEEVDMAELARSAAQAILGGREGVSIDIPPELDTHINAEREGIAQAIEHLLDNARKFAPDGEIKVSISRSERFLDLCVSDQGPGIARVDQERIFERFVRLGEPLTRETQGPGVGLFIVKSVVTAHRGRAWVDSTPGRGAAFHILLPLSRPLRVAPQPVTNVS